MDASSPIVILCYILAIFAIGSSSYALIGICKLPNKTIAKRLLVFLHLSLLIEEIVLLPFAFTSNTQLCHLIGFLNCYSSLSNVIAMWLITSYSVNYIHCDIPRIDRFIYRFKELLCFLFPLITVFPFIKNDYGDPNQAWCELNYLSNKHEAFELGIVFYFFWIWAFTILSIIILAVAIVDGSSRSGGCSIVKSIISNMGAYGHVTLLSTILHTIRKFMENQLSDEDILCLTMPIYVAGIVYGLLFLWNPSMAQLPDKAHTRETGFEFQLSDLGDVFNNPLRITSAVHNNNHPPHRQTESGNLDLTSNHSNADSA